MPNLRLIPVTIFVAALLLTIKIGNIWSVFTDGSQSVVQVQPVSAQQAADENKEANPAQPQQEKADAPGQAPPAIANVPQDPAAGSGQLGDVRNLSPSEIRLLQELGERRRALDARSRQLEQREALLKAAESRLVEKQNELVRIKEEIAVLLDQKDKEEVESSKKLVNLYSNMKPKDAANIFNGLDLPVLLGIMKNMNERKLAPIVAAMEPKRARLVTSELADQRRIPDVPK